MTGWQTGSLYAFCTMAEDAEAAAVGDVIEKTVAVVKSAAHKRMSFLASLQTATALQSRHSIDEKHF